jgi:Flp pilus assembly protein CpaB
MPMKPVQIISVALLALVTCSSVMAQENAAAGNPSPPAKQIKEKKICHHEVSTGSMLAHSTCRTASEWKAIDEANQEAIQHQRNSSSGGRGQ